MGLYLHARHSHICYVCRRLRCCAIPARSASMMQNRLRLPTSPANLLPHSTGRTSMCFAQLTMPFAISKLPCIQAVERQQWTPFWCLWRLGFDLCIVAMFPCIPWKPLAWVVPYVLRVFHNSTSYNIQFRVECLIMVSCVSSGRMIQMSHGKAVHCVANCTRWSGQTRLRKMPAGVRSATATTR